ncbi:MAG: hypothetical protein GPOALKHO_001908 [Sodalis sp.]|nr:MAG: hypothetical protein GPOALKHO_001908 [Sodalis sp.]
MEQPDDVIIEQFLVPYGLNAILRKTRFPSSSAASYRLDLQALDLAMALVARLPERERGGFAGLSC